MPESEISQSYMSDDVANVLGELTNQMVGDFTFKVRDKLQTHITQSQPKMMAITKLVQISVDTAMDRPQMRRVTFATATNKIFYLEFAMDKTEFIQLHDFDAVETIDPDEILEQSAKEMADTADAPSAPNEEKMTLMMTLWHHLVCKSLKAISFKASELLSINNSIRIDVQGSTNAP